MELVVHGICFHVGVCDKFSVLFDERNSLVVRFRIFDKIPKALHCIVYCSGIISGL